MKPVILTLTPWYLPGFRAGGPIRSVAGLAELLGDDFDFRIITSDRDLGINRPYPKAVPCSWQKAGNAHVYFLPPRQINPLYLMRLINSVRHDILYLNSFFSPGFTFMPLILRRLGLIRRSNVILAPLGELGSGALKVKAKKKNAFICLARALGIYRGLTWKATSLHEMCDIHNFIRAENIQADPASIVLAPELFLALPQARESAAFDKQAVIKQPGSLKLIFISRICPMKNLDLALEALQAVDGKIVFDIYGPVEDEDYWRRCQEIITSLDGNITVRYLGAIEHRQVSAAMREHHMLFLPTRGENFGHAILEALISGCPVIISDKTRWRRLEEAGAGWDLPLLGPEAFKEALRRSVAMDDAQMRRMSLAAKRYGEEKMTSKENLDQNRSLFQNAAPAYIREWRQPCSMARP